MKNIQFEHRHTSSTHYLLVSDIVRDP